LSSPGSPLSKTPKQVIFLTLSTFCHFYHTITLLSILLFFVERQIFFNLQGEKVKHNISSVQVTWDVKACNEYTCLELFDQPTVSLEELGLWLGASAGASEIFSSAFSASGGKDKKIDSPRERYVKYKKRRSGTRMEHCSYFHSVFY
jgi:hypothetical protein